MSGLLAGKAPESLPLSSQRQGHGRALAMCPRARSPLILKDLSPVPEKKSRTPGSRSLLVGLWLSGICPVLVLNGDTLLFGFLATSSRTQASPGHLAILRQTLTF